jgi:phosphomevalonate kinase
VISATDFDEGPSEGRNLAHNLAQFVHCLAQGKVGSGFDVSAAVFGSQLYTRFDPLRLQPLMEGDAFTTRPLQPFLLSSDKALDHCVAPFKLPPLTRLMLADVDAGSDTPSFVGKVLRWRKAKSEQAHALWTALDQSNQALARILLSLSDMHARDPVSYTDAVKYMSSLQNVQWFAAPGTAPTHKSVVDAFREAHETSEDIRAMMRDMGDLSGVPIEPKEQTALLDVCMAQAGVIGGGVPGAGGYDAIWLLICDPVDQSNDQKALERVEQVWSTYTDLYVSPLSSVESVAKGARIERLEDIAGLREIV